MPLPRSGKRRGIMISCCSIWAPASNQRCAAWPPSLTCLLVLATDEPTSLTDAYAVLKLHAADRADGAACVVVNQAASRSSGERTYAALHRACTTFLRRNPPLMGVIRRDERVKDAIRRQSLLLIRHPGCPAALDAEADRPRPDDVTRRYALAGSLPPGCSPTLGSGGVGMQLVRSGGRRDLRVDFFRGLALWWIFTDHVPGDVLAHYTLQNFTMCDATEVFVLLAGYGGGLAYGRTMDRQGYLYAGADTLRRAWTLYIAHIFLFVVFTAQVAYSATLLDRAYYLDEAKLDVLADAPYRAMLEALLLRFQPNLLNILPLYVMLLLIFALALPLLRWPKLLLCASFALYAVVRVTGLNLAGWTGEDWYFNPFAWQFLFMIGAVLAYAPPPLPRPRWLFDIVSALILIAGVTVIWVIDTHPRILAQMPHAVIRFVITEDKTGLHPFRLMSILSLTWLGVRLIPFNAAWLRSRPAAPLVLLGQNSLPVFCSGIFFGFIARLGLEYDDGAMMQFGVNLSGACAMIAVGAMAAWYRGKGRVVAAPHPVALPLAAGTDTR